MSVALPESLSPWRDWLAWFEPEIVEALGGLLLRLAPVLRDFGTFATRGEPEPVGVDDLRRRGSYDRLLLSEWVLADEVPDEFDRRAAQGEHLFLHPRLATARGEHGTIALFDTGPAQIGAARLAQVALWILLARRSRAAGGGFQWGSLQRPGRLDGAERVDQLKNFLATRSLDRVPADGLMAWGRRWSDPELPAGERWLVGSRRRDLDGATHHVLLRPRLDGRIDLEISVGRLRRALTIKPPATAAATRLLSGSFQPSAVPLPTLTAKLQDDKERLSLTQPPLIAAGGGRILVPLLGTNAACVWTRHRTWHPRAPKWTIGRQRWRATTELLTAALCGRSFGGLLRSRDKFRFWKLVGLDSRERPLPALFKAPPGRAHWLPSVWSSGGEAAFTLNVVDAAGQLWRWINRGDGFTTAVPIHEEPWDHGVLALAADHGDAVVYARRRGARVELVWRGNAGERELAAIDAAAAGDEAVISNWRTANGWSAALAVPKGPARGGGVAWALAEWRNLTRQVNLHDILVPASLTVIGIGQAGVTDLDRVALVAIDPERRQLHRIDLNGRREPVYTHPVAIATVTMATDVPLIALVDQQRRLTVIDSDDAEGRHWKPWGRVNNDAD